MSVSNTLALTLVTSGPVDLAAVSRALTFIKNVVAVRVEPDLEQAAEESTAAEIASTTAEGESAPEPSAPIDEKFSRVGVAKDEIVGDDDGA